MELVWIERAIVAAALGYFVWTQRRNTVNMGAINESQTKMRIDIAVVKKVIEPVGKDHDNLVRLDLKVEGLGEDLNHAHEKIRNMANG